MKRGVILVSPRRSVRVSITVVVAQQIVAMGGLVRGNLQRLVHSRQQMLAQVRDEVNQIGQVVLDVGGGAFSA